LKGPPGATPRARLRGAPPAGSAFTHDAATAPGARWPSRFDPASRSGRHRLHLAQQPAGASSAIAAAPLHLLSPSSRAAAPPGTPRRCVLLLLLLRASNSTAGAWSTPPPSPFFWVRHDRSGPAAHHCRSDGQVFPSH
ncbi:hypothetical protein Taro_001441, partial [Colocasia esculenta]|nr:hypothetical protein [Colocasia esculenta]